MSSEAEHVPNPILRIPEARKEQGVPGSRGKEKGKVLEGGGTTIPLFPFERSISWMSPGGRPKKDAES
jgi:hypothetical protein